MGVDTGRLRVVSAEATPHEIPAESGTNLALDRRSAAAERKDPRSETSTGTDAESADRYSSPGPYIRAQRMRQGLSLDQLAAQTKIPRAQLELLEADRYEELPGMVFAKGFLRVCARTLELDEDTVLGLLYERERVALRQRRREASSTTALEGRQVLRADPRASKSKRSKHPVQVMIDGALDYVSAWIADLPRAQILMWIVVALLVALVVFIAFTLASSQADSLMIRS